MIIDVKNLFSSYGDKTILKDISLSIARNELTGIIGPNGSGKSTFIKNIIKYVSGEYSKFEINKKSLKDLTARELSREIAYIPQKSRLISSINVFEFILLGRFPLLKNTWDSYSFKDYEIVEAKIDVLDIRNLRDRKIETLSGGELQKVLLAKALVQESKILLLDEPTSALDLNNAVEFMKILKKISIKKEVTPIIVIHDLNLASLFCDNLIVFKEGEFYKKGSPQEIISIKNMKEIYDLDCQIVYNNEGKPYIIPETY